MTSLETEEKARNLYYKIKSQRMGIIAPVDTQGCAQASKSENAETRKFQILISLLLSSQTKDEVTYQAIVNLKNNLPQSGSNKDGLTAENVMSSDIEFINNLIGKVGFHNKKALNIRR
jgi:endonuclease-3